MVVYGLAARMYGWTDGVAEVRESERTEVGCVGGCRRSVRFGMDCEWILTLINVLTVLD